MFCPNCGTEQLKGATFCNICGSELPKLPESSEKVSNSPSPKDLPNININNDKAQFIPNMDMPNQYPNQMPMGMPNQYPNQMPMGMPNQYPNQMPMGMPNQYPNQMPMGMPNQYPNQMPMGIPNQYPNQMPMGIPNQQINININNEQKKSSKNKILAIILAFFFGGFGIHKFYLGKPGWGLLYLLTFWTGIPYCVSLIESIMYLCTSDDDWNKKY